jgi:hypothetical protein
MKQALARKRAVAYWEHEVDKEPKDAFRWR